MPHPRGYGNAVRVLGRYVRELKVLTLEEAIRKMTTLPADQFGFADRGRLAPGMAADIVIFDAGTVADRATYANPHAYPVGIAHVLVNGVAVVEGGEQTTARPGRVLRRAGPFSRALARTSAADQPAARSSRTPVAPSDLLSFSEAEAITSG